ncbi:MAG: 3-deoxy-D-manno-octulosonic acid transferase [Pseudomonadota bacterium]
MFQELAARLALGAYGAFGRLAAPWVRVHLGRRAARGREDPTRLHERFGRPDRPRPEGPMIWLHAASVGESLSSLALLEAIAQRRPEACLLMTSGTVTSAKLMAERLPERVIHQYIPVDLPAAVEGFLDHWRPDLGLLIESELWPTLVTKARQHGAELALINARMSEKSFRNWRLARPVMAQLLSSFSLVLAQSEKDRARLAALGAADCRCLGNLKSAAPAPSAEPQELADLQDRVRGRPLWLAASTHPGEEEIVAQAHERLESKHPGLLTLLVPRHPERGSEIAASLAERGLAVALRSRGQAIEGGTDIYLADTLGELGLWFRLADIVFLGGSLVPVGGHNLLEPAKLGCALLSGPQLANFADIANALEAVGGLERVVDESGLSATVARLLADPAACAAMGQAARVAAEKESQVLEKMMAALEPALRRVKSPQEHR